MISDLAFKLAQAIEQIPKNVLYGFFCDYAQSHDEQAYCYQRATLPIASPRSSVALVTPRA